MKSKFNGVLTLLLALIVQFTFAQERQISGTVSDESGPLPGVSVVIKGTGTGVETDFDGLYEIIAKQGDVLVFNYVGMETRTKTVGTSNQLNVVLKGSNLLDEIVIIGYGTSTKQSFTGSAKVVKAEVLELKSVSNISQALAGEVAGVNVINNSGQPGSSATIRIRGFGSINGNRDPLYVVDGVPFSGSISSINPADIASTTVLKDATATAIYGSRGANGVILIQTKTGKNGEAVTVVDVKTGYNFSYLPRYNTISNPNTFIETAWESVRNTAAWNNPNMSLADQILEANATLFSKQGISPDYNFYNVTDIANLIDPLTGKIRKGVTRRYSPENWSDYGFQTSKRTEVNLKMSGGSPKTKYFASFGHLNDEGYVINSNYKRLSTRLNVTHKPKDYITANANIGYAYSETTNNGQSEDSGSVFWFIDNIPAIYPLFERDANGAMIPDSKYGGNVYDYGEKGRGFGALTNSISDAHHDDKGNNRHEFNGNFSLNFELAENLFFENKYGVQYYTRTYNSIKNPFYGGGKASQGSIYQKKSNALTQNFLNLLRYSVNFNNHNLEFLVAHESNQWQYNTSDASKEKVVNLVHGLDQLDNYVMTSSPSSGYRIETAIESYFGQVNYNLNQKYYITASVRRDGSSRFTEDKWGTFGSLGVSWLLNKENFMDDVAFVDFLKVKTSYGLIGDQAGVDYYSGQNYYSINNLNDQISLGVVPIKNPALTWETSKIFQVGIESTLFDNVLDVSFDYYIKNTEDQIFDRRMGPSIGDALITGNDGSLRNSGFEFDISARLIKKKNFSLNFGINGEMLKNELTNMPIDPATGKQKVLDIGGIYGRAAGHSIYDMYMREWAGVDVANGDPLWNVYYHDANDNGVRDDEEGIKTLTNYKQKNPDDKISKETTNIYADATQKFIGKSAIPVVRGAFRLNGKFHAFDFSTQFAYSLGGYAYDGAYAGLLDNGKIGENNWHKDIKNSWKKPGDITNVPLLLNNENVKANSTSTRFITSSDYLALNNLKLGYTLNKSFVQRAGISNVNIWIAGDNLFLLSARDGFNPATSETGATSTYRYSPLTTVTLGLRVKF
ncbi:MAG: SusC/RagA family TonB-linked outer membrane protein [Flavobacteriaceae bacterium]|nr:MAG: SusC/RagA family TonB-linked outer membrane protein [Flavobacteriaceae bacterium]